MIRKSLVIGLIILLTSFCFALTANDLFWDGYLSINLNKEVFVASGEIIGELIITNEEYFPLLDSTIIIQIATGENGYPSHLFSENIISEQIIKNVLVLPRANKVIPFKINAPKYSGNYHLSIYSWAQKSMFNGGDSILLNALTKDFIVEGNNLDNVVQISRAKTRFGEIEEIGPVGFPSSVSEKFFGKIVVENLSDITVNNLVLDVMVCDWACSISNIVSTQSINVGELVANSEKEIIVELASPKVPSAYEIKMVLKNNEIKSIYSNRLIVSGGTAKIRKSMLYGLEDQNFWVRTIFAGSPDHFFYPEFKNFDLEFEVFNNNISLLLNKKSFDSILTGDIFDANFSIGSQKFNKFCLRVRKDNVLFEEECVLVDLDALLKGEEERNPRLVEVIYEYNESGKNLDLVLNKFGEKINARLQLINFEKNIVNELIEQDNSFEKRIFVEPGKYLLIVSDFDAKRQVKLDLFLGINEDDLHTGEEIVPLDELPCKGFICEEGFVCEGTPVLSKDGFCCQTNCIPNDQTVFDFGLIVPLLFWIAVLIFVGAVFILHNSTKKVRGRKK